jgi:intein/homing endonuclease
LELQDTSECIFVDELVETLGGETKKISDVVPGDQLISQDEFKTVMFVHHKKPKDCVRITLKSGKSIIVSKDHVFPTKSGRKSVNTGLNVGDLLNSK